MSGRDRFDQALHRADEFDRVLGTHMEPTRRILARKRDETTFGIEREQLEDRPCMMNPEDDCSAVLPCALCPVSLDSGGNAT